MIEQVFIDPSRGYKYVDNRLCIERKDKYIFSFHYANQLGTIADYVFSNTDVSKQGAIDLLNYMMSFSVSNEETWEVLEKNYDNVNFIYIAYYSLYSFELRGVEIEESIPKEGEGADKVFVSNDVNDQGMQTLLIEFMSWYQEQ